MSSTCFAVWPTFSTASVSALCQTAWPARDCRYEPGLALLLKSRRLESGATKSAARRDLFIELDDKATKAPLGMASKIGLALYAAPNGAWRVRGMHFPINVSRLMALMCFSELFNRAVENQNSRCRQPESLLSLTSSRAGAG